MLGGIAIEFLDFFAGIGCFRFGFEKAGLIFCDYREIDEYANKSYQLRITQR
jgi:site-specific DNA-cytosine methylase